MSNQIVTSNEIESAMIVGDLSKLSPEQRVNHYLAVCKSTGLNPLTKPFDYLTLNGRMVLYARKDATDQLRKANGVSIIKLDRETVDSVYVVTAYARDSHGREDSSIGAVNIGGIKADALANAMMKAETKAKRRVTLSICGLGWLDETELETIPNAQTVSISETGEIVPDTTLTLAEAMDMRTPKGAQLGELSVDQLYIVAGKTEPGAPLHEAALLVINSNVTEIE